MLKDTIAIGVGMIISIVILIVIGRSLVVTVAPVQQACHDDRANPFCGNQ